MFGCSQMETLLLRTPLSGQNGSAKIAFYYAAMRDWGRLSDVDYQVAGLFFRGSI